MMYQLEELKPVLGKIRMHVKHEGQEEVLPVIVVKDWAKLHGKRLAQQDQSKFLGSSQPN